MTDAIIYMAMCKGDVRRPSGRNAAERADEKQGACNHVRRPQAPEPERLPPVLVSDGGVDLLPPVDALGGTSIRSPFSGGGQFFVSPSCGVPPAIPLRAGDWMDVRGDNIPEAQSTQRKDIQVLSFSSL